MRFSIWTAVSKPAQAKGWDKPEEEAEIDDKESLREQEKKCRAVGIAKSWLESAGPYVVPGQSRTKYVNLRDAENEIPAMRAMLEGAKAHEYDILILYDYNRLRDLLDQVAKTLASYGVQIYSVNQPIEPMEPQEFNPYASDSSSMMMGMNQIISRWQVADLRRKYRFGVSKRVNNGLTSLRVPYGYRKPPGLDLDKNAIAIQAPATIAIVAEIKDLFLAGKSYYDIRDLLNARSVPSPQGGKLGWSHTSIKKILTNPFYAGKVFFGRTKTIRDPHRNTVRLQQNPDALIKPGKHKAIFTEAEYHAIQVEVKRREGLPHRNRYHFAGLLTCSVCGAHLVHDHGVWRCKPKGNKKDHIGLTVTEALALIPRALQKAFREQQPQTTALAATSANPNAELDKLEHQRRQVQSRLEAEIYTDEEAEQKIKHINAQIRELKNNEGNQLRRQAQRQQFLKTFEETQAIIQHLPRWMKEEDSRKVNTILLRLCREIVVTPEGDFTIHFRQ